MINTECGVVKKWKHASSDGSKLRVVDMMEVSRQSWLRLKSTGQIHGASFNGRNPLSGHSANHNCPKIAYLSAGSGSTCDPLTQLNVL